MTLDDSAPEIVEAPPRVAAYTQMLEIAGGLTRGELALEDAETLWDELDVYLVSELERFGAYPQHDWPAYTEGLALVSRGLQTLLGSVQAARACGLDDGIQGEAEAGSNDVVRGRVLLVAAHEEALRDQAGEMSVDSGPDQVDLHDAAATGEGGQETPS